MPHLTYLSLGGNTGAGYMLAVVQLSADLTKGS